MSRGVLQFDFSKIRDDGPGEEMLVTFKNWIMARDGNVYQYAWGVCKILQSKDIVGFNVAGDANWVVQIGEEANALFVLGCQIRAFALGGFTEEMRKNNNILKVL